MAFEIDGLRRRFGRGGGHAREDPNREPTDYSHDEPGGGIGRPG
jgi:hypothetical protein